MLNTEVMPSKTMDKMDVFLPVAIGADAVQKRATKNYNIVVRMKPGVFRCQQAQADISVIAKSDPREGPSADLKLRHARGGIGRSRSWGGRSPSAA